MVIESHRSEQQTDAKNGEREEDPHGIIISHQYRLPRETAGAGSQSAPADLLDGNQHLFATSRAIARRGLPWRVRLERAPLIWCDHAIQRATRSRIAAARSCFENLRASHGRANAL